MAYITGVQFRLGRITRPCACAVPAVRTLMYALCACAVFVWRVGSSQVPLLRAVVYVMAEQRARDQGAPSPACSFQESWRELYTKLPCPITVASSLTVTVYLSLVLPHTLLRSTTTTTQMSQCTWMPDTFHNSPSDITWISLPSSIFSWLPQTLKIFQTKIYRKTSWTQNFPNYGRLLLLNVVVFVCAVESIQWTKLGQLFSAMTDDNPNGPGLKWLLILENHEGWLQY